MTISRTQTPPPALRGSLPEGERGWKAKSTFRVGIVTITQKSERSFMLRYRDPGTKLDVRRRLSGVEPRELRTIAMHISKQVLSDKGFLPGEDPVPGLEEGIAESLRLARMRDTTRSDLARRSRQFLAYMAEKFPAVRTWADFKPLHLQSFIKASEEQGLAFDSIRLRVVPIRQAWRHISENYPGLVPPVTRTKICAERRREIQCLEPGELEILLAWLREHAPELWTMGCLQGLAGLRGLEAASLRAQDVNLEEGTILIADTGEHVPKNRSSFRRIPVCAEIVEALRFAMAGQKIRPASGELFVNRRGGLWELNVLSHKWISVLRRATRDLGLPRIASIPPKKLRASFATMAGHLGIPDRPLKAYMGHVQADVLGTHYQRIDLEDLRAVSDAMNGWHGLVKKGEVGKKLANLDSLGS